MAQDLERADRGQETIAAADCLYELGGFVAAALRYRKLAQLHPVGIDVHANDEAIKHLESALSRMEGTLAELQ